MENNLITNEDFEAEWQEYFKYRGNVATVNIKDIALHFANWQKRQLMKDAVDAEVNYWNLRGLSIRTEIDLEDLAEEGDKVKIIIIKED